MTEKVLLKKIGAKIVEIRREKGMSQQDLAAKLNYEKSNMSRLESGNVNLRVGTLYKVARALGISLSELLRIK